MTVPLALSRPTAGRVLGGGGLVLLSVVLLVVGRHVDGARPVVLGTGVAAIGVAGLAVLLRRRSGNSLKYVGAALLWGVGAAVAGLFPSVGLGPFTLPSAVLVVGELGVLGVLLHMLVRARAGSDDPPLVVDALMLGTALSTAGWDVFARIGHGNTGTHGWIATTAVVVCVTSVVVCSAIALAVEQPRLRTAAALLILHGIGTAAVVVYFADRDVAAAGACVAVVCGGLGVLLLPRDGVVRHGGAAAERAARRLEIASLAPGPILLIDIVLLVVSPRADPVLFGMFVSVLVTFTIRHAATARSIDRTTGHLKFQALHDPLTGLGNRARLKQALTTPDHVQSLVLLDLVGLDDVNDVLGVNAGDGLIVAAAGDLERTSGWLGGTAFRTGGAQFGVLLPGDPAQCLRHAEALIAAINAAPGKVEGAARFPLSAVAGIAVCPVVADSGDEYEVMTPFVHADIALRDAKPLDGSSVSVYSGDVAAGHARRSLVRDRLATAIRDGGIDVHYQPVVSFTTGRVEKFEALARWDDANLGRIPPTEFIAVAEESNLVVALGEQVLRQAVQWAAEAGVFSVGVGLAVNVSVVQLQSPGFSDIVREILHQHRIPANLLTLELTESVFLDQDSPAERVVTELAAMGCRIAIDDFGTGYSAFGYLRRLPVHVLKIDRSLTQALTEDVNGQSVVTCVVDLATRLGLTVIVEGVETDEEAAICKFISAALGQGWLYSAAVPREQLGEQLTRVYPVPEPMAVDDSRR